MSFVIFFDDLFFRVRKVSNKQQQSERRAGARYPISRHFPRPLGWPRGWPPSHTYQKPRLQQSEQFFESSRRRKVGGGGRGPVWTKLSGDHHDEPSTRRPRGPPSPSRPRLPAIDLPPKRRRWNIAHHQVEWKQCHLTKEIWTENFENKWRCNG